MNSAIKEMKARIDEWYKTGERIKVKAIADGWFNEDEKPFCYKENVYEAIKFDKSPAGFHDPGDDDMVWYEVFDESVNDVFAHSMEEDFFNEYFIEEK